MADEPTPPGRQPAPTWPQVERRSGLDRRERPTPAISRFWLRGRRRGGRRADDARAPYVDRYKTGDVLLALGIVVLCTADYLLTMELLPLGAVEANPVMDFFIRQGSGAFGAAKLGVTLFGMLFLLMHIRVRRVRAAMLVVLVLYVALMFWHLWVSWDMHQTLVGGA